MSGASVLGPPRVRRRLAELPDRPLNFDPAELEHASATSGWTITDLCQPLPSEPPGAPVPEGSWEVARRLMSGYEFADPSIVRAYYDPEVPLERRNMLLKLQALGVLHLFAGVRVGDVYEQTRVLGQRHVCVWGWNYRTLEGHVERGQMDWEVWKWLDDGTVEFRVHAVSRPAHIPNPLFRLGFHLLRDRERGAFLASTKHRMRKFTELALAGEHQKLPGLAADLTARPAADDSAHDALSEQARRD